MSISPVAVLTGDLIGSRTHDPDAVDSAIVELERAASDIGDAWHFDPRFTRFRGDGWQILLPDPAHALDSCIYLQARLKAGKNTLQTRISAGIGAAANVGKNDLSGATGPAFFVSGDLLDAMPKNRTLVVGGAGIGAWQTAVVELVEWIMGTWTTTQAEAAGQAVLYEITNAQHASRLGITRQAFESRLGGAGFAALETARQAFRKHNYSEAKSK